MLTPRFQWSCTEPGCCVFSGGTEQHDIYMTSCHDRPWDPGVMLVSQDGFDYEFTDQALFAKHLESVNDLSGAERAALEQALTFVQCFFPTPERWAMNEIAKASEE